MKHTLVICDPETDYAGRLMEFMNRRRSFPLRAAAFDSFSQAADYIRENGADMLLMSETYPLKEAERLDIKNIILLTGEKEADGGGHRTICKYQAAETIARETQSAFDAERRAGGGPPLRTSRGRIYCVYSPVGGSGKTSFALTLGQELARRGRALYLNMESCSALPAILGVEKERNISDMVYMMRRDPENLPEKLFEMTVNIQNLDCVMPSVSFEDNASIDAGEWIRILERIASLGAYDTVIIEPAAGMRGFISILEYCTAVFMPFRGDPISLAKTECFERMLDDCGAEGILEKTLKVRVPFFNAPGLGRNYYEGLLWSELGDCVRGLVGKEMIA